MYFNVFLVDLDKPWVESKVMKMYFFCAQNVLVDFHFLIFFGWSKQNLRTYNENTSSNTHPDVIS